MILRDNPEGGASAASLNRLQLFCSEIVNFISMIAMDPHLYFAHKLNGEIQAARTPAALEPIMVGLIDWVELMSPTDAQIERLDMALGRAGLPSFSLLRMTDYREAGCVLARGYARSINELGLVQGIIDSDHALAPTDRQLATQLIAANHD